MLGDADDDIAAGAAAVRERGEQMEGATATLARTQAELRDAQAALVGAEQQRSVGAGAGTIEA